MNNSDNIRSFVEQTGDQIVVDYIDGRFCIENKAFVEGRRGNKIFIKVFGTSLEEAIENFCFEWDRYKLNATRIPNDIESYMWYSSH